MHVLYLTQTGLAEPLARSQVIPYIRGLAEQGHHFTVLSFERRADLKAGRSAAAAGLLPEGSRWVRLNYHRRPPVLSTAFDVAQGVVRAGLVRDVDLIHARSTVPALVAATASTLTHVPWIFDVRGFLAQEYVDVGYWREDSWVARLTARFEEALIGRAAGRVFLTRRALSMKEGVAFEKGGASAVIPCAVDLERFRFSPDARSARRTQLGLRPEALVVAYAGSLGNWNLAPEVARFHARILGRRADAVLLFLTRDVEVAAVAARAEGVEGTTRILTVSPDDVASFLSAADLGVAFATVKASRMASSPTKIAEYLACGLPVVTNTGVGDLEELAGEAAVILADGLGVEDLDGAAQRALERLSSPGIREKARDLARREFSLGEAVQRYAHLYARVGSASGQALIP